MKGPLFLSGAILIASALLTSCSTQANNRKLYSPPGPDGYYQKMLTKMNNRGQDWGKRPLPEDRKLEPRAATIQQ